MKLTLLGDAEGWAESDQDGNIRVIVTVLRSNVSDNSSRCSHILYADNAGAATKCIYSEMTDRCNGNSETASKLKKGRKISLTGDVEAELVFDGSEDLVIQSRVKSSDCAYKDGEGNNISETYETKENVAALRNELPPFTFSIEEFENNPCLLLTDSTGKSFRFIGEAVS